jgi:glutamate synthase (NADPH/NADH) small chain
MRLGADHVYLVYRRSRDEMPARIEEIHHAEQEGIELHLLTNPIRYIGNDKGWVVV